MPATGIVLPRQTVLVAIALATLLASATASSQAVFGVAECADGDVPNVIECLEERCNGAHAESRTRDLAACVALGWRFACGEGVDVDGPIAMDRFVLACDNGYTSGCAEFEQIRSLVPLDCSTAPSRQEAAFQGTPGVRRLGLFGEQCSLGTDCASGFCGNGSCAPVGFSYIPPGSFLMGSPESETGRDDDEVQHSVTLTRGVFLQQAEVTQGQWFALMGNNPASFGSCGAACPVDGVNWFDAISYANALSEAEGLTPCYALSGCIGGPGARTECSDVLVTAANGNPLECEGYRLPTEAEWEYAARAGTTSATYLGGLRGSTDCERQPDLEPIGWYCGNSDEMTHPAGSRAANAWGLVDVLGNVWEWCWDDYGAYPSYAVSDPLGASSGTHRVLRGGSWFNGARYARAAARNHYSPTDRFNNVGFRLARTAP